MSPSAKQFKNHWDREYIDRVSSREQYDNTFVRMRDNSVQVSLAGAIISFLILMLIPSEALSLRLYSTTKFKEIDYQIITLLNK